jgi:MFS family permease
LGGLVADRWSKRQVLIFTQSCFGLTAAALGITDGLGQARPLEVFILVALFGLINVVDGPARQAFVPEMVGSRQMANAVALNSLVFNGARVVGPALGGILIATVGTALCFDLNAVSYLAVIAGLWMMNAKELHSSRRPTGVRPGMLAQLREGVGYVRRTPEVAMVIVLMAVVGTFSYNLTLMITSLARDGLHTGASGFGLLSAALGVGALLGALGVAYAGRASIPALLVGCGVFGGFLALAGQTDGLFQAMVLLTLAGMGMIVYSAMSNSVVQTFTPSPLRGSCHVAVSLGFSGHQPDRQPALRRYRAGLGEPDRNGLRRCGRNAGGARRHLVVAPSISVAAALCRRVGVGRIGVDRVDRSPDGVIAAVDVDYLPGRGWEVVGQQGHHRLADRGRNLERPHPSGARLSKISGKDGKPGMPLAEVV